MIQFASLLLGLAMADLRIRLTRAWFWVVRVPFLILRAALQPQSWPHKKSVLGHTVDVIKAVWRRRREFEQLGVSKWHALLAALIHDLGKPQVARRRRNGRVGTRGSWFFPDHEAAIANQIVGLVHPTVWFIVRYHHLPIERWEWLFPEEVAQALYGSGLDVKWGRVLALFAECDGEGLVEDFTPANVQQFKALLDVVEQTSFTTCRVCGGWSPAFLVETQRGSDYRTACCELGGRK